MYLRSQGRIRIRAVFLGVPIGLAMAGCFLLWTNKGVYVKQTSLMRYNDGERIFLYLVR